jgi:hypothetical protein
MGWEKNWLRLSCGFVGVLEVEKEIRLNSDLIVRLLFCIDIFIVVLGFRF